MNSTSCNTRVIASTAAPSRQPGSGKESLNIHERIKWMVLQRLNSKATKAAAAESLGIGIQKLDSYISQFNIQRHEEGGSYYIKVKKLVTI